MLSCTVQILLYRTIKERISYFFFTSFFNASFEIHTHKELQRKKLINPHLIFFKSEIPFLTYRTVLALKSCGFQRTTILTWSNYSYVPYVRWENNVKKGFNIDLKIRFLLSYNCICTYVCLQV